ncbi:MAG: hypothetical protein ACETWE_09570 [Candidatus Bathyarchaeia archaeon]
MIILNLVFIGLGDASPFVRPTAFSVIENDRVVVYGVRCTKYPSEEEVEVGETVTVSIEVENFGNRSFQLMVYEQRPLAPLKLSEGTRGGMVYFGPLNPENTVRVQYKVTTDAPGTYTISESMMRLYDSKGFVTMDFIQGFEVRFRATSEAGGASIYFQPTALVVALILPILILALIWLLRSRRRAVPSS